LSFALLFASKTIALLFCVSLISKSVLLRRAFLTKSSKSFKLSAFNLFDSAKKFLIALSSVVTVSTIFLTPSICAFTISSIISFCLSAPSFLASSNFFSCSSVRFAFFISV
jgi:hypothetical protein